MEGHEDKIGWTREVYGIEVLFHLPTNGTTLLPYVQEMAGGKSDEHDKRNSDDIYTVWKRICLLNIPKDNQMTNGQSCK